MKKIIVLFSALLIAFCSYAQEGEKRTPGTRMTVEERAKRTTEWMVAELNMTEEQVSPVDSINLLYTKTLHVLIQSAEGDRDKIKESLDALEEKKVEALSTVLTPEQITAYKEKTKTMRENMRNREGRGNREGNRGRRPAAQSGE